MDAYKHCTYCEQETISRVHFCRANMLLMFTDCEAIIPLLHKGRWNLAGDVGSIPAKFHLNGATRLSPLWGKSRLHSERNSSSSLVFWQSWQYKLILQNCQTTTTTTTILWPARPVKNWRILVEQSFTAHMPLLMATSAFNSKGRC